MGLKLNTASSGSVTIEPTNTASDYTLTVPAQTGTVVATDASGNVGIGTSSPAKKLDVTGTYRSQIDPSNSSFFGATLTLAGDNGTNQSGARIVGGYEGGFGLLFQTSTGGQAGLASDPSLLTYTTKMKIDSSGNLLFNSGYGSVATAYGCRAWVNFDGSATVTIRGSGNVSSITDNGIGLYAVNFSTAMPDTNYAIASQGSSGNNTTRGRIVEGWASSTSSATICGSTTSPAASDFSYLMCAFFR